MRFLISALLALVFVASFVVFFLVSSVVDFVDSPERWVETAQERELRADVISLTAGYIVAEVAADDSLEPMSADQLELIVGEVITKEWFQNSLLRAHAALRSAFHGAEDTAILDLREVKQALRGALESLKTQAGDSCKGLWGEELCADLNVSERLISSFETRGREAIARINDEVDLLQSLQGPQQRTARQLNEGLKSLETVRLLALGLLIVSLAIFMARGLRPFKFLVLRTGLLAIAASVLYLIAVAVTKSFAQAAVVAGAGQLTESGATDADLKRFTGEFTSDLVGAAMSGATMPVAIIGVVAFGMVSLVLLFGRRQRQLARVALPS